MTTSKSKVGEKRLYMSADTKRVEIINSDVYCAKCRRFLGMSCDPFRESHCEDCFPLGDLTPNQ